MGSGIVTRLRYMLKRLYTPRNVLFRSPVSFNRKMHFCGSGSISIGEYTRNRGDVLIESVQKSSAIVIGQNTFFNQNCIIVCRKKITIGNDCIFGPNVCVYDHDHLLTKNRVHRYDFIDSEIYIGNNVWFGANAVILRGSTIGDGAVIGAGSVIKGSIPPHTVVHPSNQLVYQPIKNEEKENETH